MKTLGKKIILFLTMKKKTILAQFQRIKTPEEAI